jgi:hypothetical protein
MATTTMAEIEKNDETKAKETKHSSIDSKFPVLLPYTDKLFSSDRDFATFLSTLASTKASDLAVESGPPTENVDSVGKDNEANRAGIDEAGKSTAKSAPFMDALLAHDAMNHDDYTLADDNKMLTHNADVAYVSTQSPLVDLFFDLAEGFDAKSIEKTLREAWKEDPLVTLKIIFNTRSIHLGKASKPASYNALGWLYEHHPQTLLTNLVWLVRPVIEKKAPKKEDKKVDAVRVEANTGGDDDFEMIEDPAVESRDAPAGSNTTQHDVKNGVAHGYWKDLLNM